MRDSRPLTVCFIKDISVELPDHFNFKYILYLQMENQTIEAKNIWNSFYLFALQNDRLPSEIRAMTGTVYLLIGLISGILNGYIIYLLITRRKLRNECNFMMCPLIWNNIVLIFCIIPFTLLELWIDDIRTNQDFVSLKQYLYMSYVFLCFYSFVGIALYRLNKIKKNSLKRTTSIWKPVLFLVTGLVISSIVPFFDAIILTKYGTRASFISATVKVSTVTCLVFLSYIGILNIAEKSQKNLLKLGNHKDENICRQRSRKLRRNINLVLGSSVSLIVPALVQIPLSTYNLWKPKFYNERITVLIAVNVISIIITLVNGITNPLVYFYTQIDIKKEVRSLRIKEKALNLLRNIELRFRSLLIFVKTDQNPEIIRELN